MNVQIWQAVMYTVVLAVVCFGIGMYLAARRNQQEKQKEKEKQLAKTQGSEDLDRGYEDPVTAWNPYARQTQVKDIK